MRSVGDVLLVRLNETRTGAPKLRPAIVLAVLPGEFQTLLMYGLSSQDRSVVDGWDEPLIPGTDEFRSAGLHRQSYARLSFLHALPEHEIVGRVGAVPEHFIRQLRRRLAEHLGE